MNPLLQQISLTNTSISSFRFLSSLALLESPLSSQSRGDYTQTYFNPFHIFNAQTKTPNSSVKHIQSIHAHTIKTSLLQSDIFVANSAIEWYCKSAKMVDALHLFDEISEPNLVSWNLLISGYNQSLWYEDSWKTFCKMWGLGYDPDQFSYGSVLSACAALQAVCNGSQVYALTLKNGNFSNGYVRTGMIDLFAKSSCFEEALRVFGDVLCGNVVCWNSIISAAVKNKENWVALDIFNQMLDGHLRPNNYTYPGVLSACTTLGGIQIGRGVHGLVIKCGFEEDVYVGTAIVDLYTKCGDLDDAIVGFSRMSSHNVVSWTAIISGFVQRGDSLAALQFFRDMRKAGMEINNYTLTSILTTCAKPQMMMEASQIHSLIIKCGFRFEPSIIDSLISMYSKMGEISLSEIVFRESRSSKKVETWAVMISGLAQNHRSGKALEFFQEMTQEGLRPNTSCSSSILSIIDCINLGRQIHCYIVKNGLVSDVCVGSALFTMYSKCGILEEAYEIFKQMGEKDEVSWTSMLSGFVEHGCADRAFHLCREMVLEGIKPDQMALSAILSACSVLPSLKKGKEVHAYALHTGMSKDILVGGGLVTMYSKSRVLVSARRVFELMPRKDNISWCALVSGYAQNECVEDSLLLYHEMLFSGLDIDPFVASSLLGMAATLAISALGKQLHAHIMKMGIGSDLSVSSALITMYSKCGSIEDSHNLFEQIKNPDLFTWTSMITGLAQHGKGVEALKLYDLMRTKGVEPDSVTFGGVLSACSHSGLVEEGYSHIRSMIEDHGIKPGSHHYACMVDLLCRSGRLEEAENFIVNMPLKPDDLVWATLLAACRVHGNVNLGRRIAKRILELEPTDAGAYVSLSNILADIGQWDEAINIRNLMKRVGVKKEPGWSSM